MQDHGVQSPTVLGIVLSRTQASKQERYVSFFDEAKMAYKTKPLHATLMEEDYVCNCVFYDIERNTTASFNKA